MSDTNRAMPDLTPPPTCVTCGYIQQTTRGQGNRSAYTSLCTLYGTDAHSERSPSGTCGPSGKNWEAKAAA